MFGICLTSPDGAGCPVTPPASRVSSSPRRVFLVQSSRGSGVRDPAASGLVVAPAKGVTFQVFEDREKGSRDLSGLLIGDWLRFIVQRQDRLEDSGFGVKSNPTTQGLIAGSIVAFDHPCSVHQMIVLDQAIKVFSPGLQSRSSSLRCLLFVTTKFKNT